MSQETVAAQDMLTGFTQWQGREPESVAADTTYGNGSSCTGWRIGASLLNMRTRDSIHRKNSPFYGPERFTYQPESNSYRCPEGETAQLCRPECSQPRSRLYRQRQTLWSMFATGAMYQRAITPQSSPRHGGKEKGGGDVCGTQECDRTASPALTSDEVRSWAVLPGSRGPEHQAVSPVPQPTDNTYYGSCHLAEGRGKSRWQR